MAKWNKGLMFALENQNDDVQDEGSVEQDMLEQQDNDEQMDEFAETAQDADDALEVGEIMSDETRSDEEKTEAVLEHFMNKMGLPNSVTLESLSGDKMKTRLMTISQVSQEGFFDRVVSGFDMMITSKKKIIDELNGVVDSVEDKETKEENIKEPGWGRAFNTSGEGTISASEVEKSIEQYVKALTGSEFDKAVSDIDEVLNTVVSNMKSKFFGKQENVDSIMATAEKADEVIQNVSTNILQPKAAKTDPDYEPLTLDQAKKLAKDVTSLFNNGKLDSQVKGLKDTVFKWTKAQTFKGPINSEFRAAYNVVKQIRPSIKAIYQAYDMRKKVAYALMQYIRASFK